MGEIPATQAIRALRAAGVPFEPLSYQYVEHGGTRVAAEALGVSEHAVVKTLVMEGGDAGRRTPFLVLMHGDQEVSTRELARVLGVKTVSPCSPAVVEKHTGYRPGGVSPFGTRTTLAVYVEETILALDRICINGGRQGLLVALAPAALTAVLSATPVRVGVGEQDARRSR